MNSGLHLAQLNIARARYPKDHAQMADFFAAVPRVNQLADQAEGFVWRWIDSYDGDSGSEQFEEFAGPYPLINLSVWVDLPALQAFVRSPEHLAIMRRRQQWFDAIASAYMVLWWVDAGHRPDLVEAADKLRLIRAQGPTLQAFNFKQNFEPSRP